MIADRSNPVRTVSRTKWATCPEGTKSWIDGGSSQTWSTSQARNVLLIPRLNHDAPSSSRKIRLLGQAPRPCGRGWCARWQESGHALTDGSVLIEAASGGSVDVTDALGGSICVQRDCFAKSLGGGRGSLPRNAANC